MKSPLTRYILLSILFTTTLNSCRFQNLQKSTDVDIKYNAALEYYEKKDYYKAGLLFEEIVPIVKFTAKGEIAQFYYAYCHYYQKQYTLSSHYFEKFYKSFYRSKYAEEGFYMYCRSMYFDTSPTHLDQKNTYVAVSALQSFLNTYKESQYKKSCEDMLDELRAKLEVKAFNQAKLYFKVNHYKAAVIALGNFLKSFPDSKFGEEITFMRVLAQYKLAKNSTERRQVERFNLVITYYENLIDNFPESKTIKDAENIYDNAINDLTKLKGNLTANK